MAWTALAMVLAGLGYGFGGRSYLAWRATGDTGLRLNAGPAGSAAWWAKTLFLASIVLLVAGPIVAIAGPGFLLWPVGPPGQAAGLAAAIAGMLIMGAAQLGMGSSWRIGVDQSEVTGLVTGGLFALSRNPIYTGMSISVAGIALMAPGFVSAAALAALVGAIQTQVRFVEEPYLAATHGQAYRDYAARIGRFLPAFGKLHDPPASRT